MTLSASIAKHLREVYLGGNWTCVSLKEKIADVAYERAGPGPFHSIATLLFHIDYYVRALTRVLEGGPLDTHDKYSFDLEALKSEAEWEKFRDGVFQNCEKLAGLIEKLPDNILWSDFGGRKNESYYRTFHGLIEHTYYHLGQIAMVKRLVIDKPKMQ